MNLCSIALVFVLDVSHSVTNERWIQQRNGHALALQSRVVQEYVELNEPILLSVVQFASHSAVARRWIMIENKLQLDNFSNYLMNMQRLDLDFYTRIHHGIEDAIRLHDAEMPCEPMRRVIDVSADGDGQDFDPAVVTDAIERGIQINGVAINGAQQNPVITVGDWMRRNMITPNGFVVESDGFDDVENAVRRKFEAELIGSLELRWRL